MSHKLCRYTATTIARRIRDVSTCKCGFHTSWYFRKYCNILTVHTHVLAHTHLQQRLKHKPSGKQLSLDKHGAGSKEDGAMAIDAKDEMDHASPAAGEAEGAGMEVEEDKPATVVRGVPSGICFGRRGRGRGFVPYGGRGRGTSCYRCGKLGHIKRDCPQRPTGASSAGKESS